MSRFLSGSRPSSRFAHLFAICCLAAGGAANGATGVEITRGNGRIAIKVDGELLTELHLAAGPKPYFYPLLGPGGVPLTRRFPMETDGSDEEKDHPHHRSLWFTHGDVNGVDFWAEGPERGRIVNQEVLEARGGTEEGVLRTANKWVSAEGKVVLTDETAFRVHRTEAGRLFDYEITLKAPEGSALTFGDTKEGTLGVRLAESMRLKPNEHYAGKATGHILQDTGVRDGDTWGKRAKWTAYSGPVAGKTMGVVIFDHPSNPRYPTWWHVRDYGLFAANPFGVHDFEKKPAGTGNLTVPAGGKITFRYRFLLQEGAPNPQQLNALAAEFAK